MVGNIVDPNYAAKLEAGEPNPDAETYKKLKEIRDNILKPYYQQLNQEKLGANMPNRPDQKNKLTDIAELQGDPGSARGEDFVVQNANRDRDKDAKKDQGKSQLMGHAAPRPNKAGK